MDCKRETDNLKVFSFLFVFGLWLPVCALSINILNQNFLVRWLLLQEEEKIEKVWQENVELNII